MGIGGDCDGVLVGTVVGEDPEGLSMRLATPAKLSRADPDPFGNEPMGTVRSTMPELLLAADRIPLGNVWPGIEVVLELMEVKENWSLVAEVGVGPTDDRKALSFSERSASSSSLEDIREARVAKLTR